MRTIKFFSSEFILAAIAVGLVSCGSGGGSGGGSSSNANSAPASPSYSLVNDSAFVMPGQTIVVDVLANDSANLQLEHVSQASLGSVAINANQIEYTAGQQGSATETLEYVAKDEQGGFGGANLQVHIAPANFNLSVFTDFLDLNGDGVSEQEILALGVNLPAGTFELFDVNADGVLDQTELQQFSLEFLNEVALPAFDAADLNGDGELNVDEAINFLPPQLSDLMTVQQLAEVEGIAGDITLSPVDLLQLSADFEQAQLQAESQSSSVMLLDSVIGNGDGLVSASEVETVLGLGGGLLPIPLPAGLDQTTVVQAVEIMDINGDGGLDQQEMELLLTMANMLGSLQSF